MSHRTLSRLPAALASIAVVGSMVLAGAGAVEAGNTRLIYFGAPADVCPADVLADTATYPNGCGGGIDASGNPVQGVEVYSPVTVTTTTATGKLVGYRLQIANAGGQTLTQVVVLGGALAGLTTNPLFPPPTVGSSLPTGFSYDRVYQVSGPTPKCTISTTVTTNDSLRCDFGNIAAGTTPTVLLIVMRTPTTSQLPTDPNTGLPMAITPQPWNELQLNEGSSTSGSNIDSFYAVGRKAGLTGALTVTASLTSYVESFSAPPGGALINVDSGVASPTALSAAKVTVPKTTNGDDSRIDVTGSPTDTSVCAFVYTCFGVGTQVSVTTPVNLVNGAGSPDTFGVPNGSGGWSVAPLQLDFRWDASEIPGKVNTKNLQVFHDGALVSTFCTTVPPQPGQALPCRTAAVQYKDKDLGLTVYSDSNGGWKPGV